VIIWISGVRLKNRISSNELNQCMSVACVVDVVRQVRLRWLGHLQGRGKDEWVSAFRNVLVTITRDKDRSKKTWKKVLNWTLSHVC